MREWLRSLLHAVGVDVRLIKNLEAAAQAARRDQEFLAWSLLGHCGFETVLDIGANEGQFATLARRLWPRAVIHSFEPLPDVHRLLLSNLGALGDAHAHRVALSDRNGHSVMNASAFSPSSSLLPMADLHRSEWPQSAQHQSIEVPIMRLDDWAAKHPLGAGPSLIKIDVQGHELAVIGGGRETIRRACAVALEVSFHELYRGQALFEQIFDAMRGLGFVYRGNIEQFRSKDGQRVLYADAVFENKEQRADER
jgi:FkbM family methyltransferase